MNHQLLLKFVVGAICTGNLLIGTRAACDINYSGDYIRVRDIQMEYVEGEIEVFQGDTSTFRILPAKEGVTNAYAIAKYINQTDAQSGSASKAVQASIEDAKNQTVMSMCVSRIKQLSTQLRCVDIDDAGMTIITPLSVDEECNLIHGQATYMEPFTPGCPPNDPKCAPAIIEGTVTRVGYSPEEGMLVSGSNRLPGFSLLWAGLVLLLIII
jgi:hypothetical protein